MGRRSDSVVVMEQVKSEMLNVWQRLPCLHLSGSMWYMGLGWDSYLASWSIGGSYSCPWSINPVPCLFGNWMNSGESLFAQCVQSLVVEVPLLKSRRTIKWKMVDFEKKGGIIGIEIIIEKHLATHFVAARDNSSGKCVVSGSWHGVMESSGKNLNLCQTTPH